MHLALNIKKITTHAKKSKYVMYFLTSFFFFCIEKNRNQQRHHCALGQVLLCTSFLLFRVKMSKRSASSKAQAFGIFAGARVIRGPDWDWGNQDGEF